MKTGSSHHRLMVAFLFVSGNPAPNFPIFPVFNKKRPQLLRPFSIKKTVLRKYILFPTAPASVN
jgi:hypothetical protein